MNHDDERDFAEEEANAQLLRDEQEPTCEYFARCGQPADGTIDHPVPGAVLCCERCARVVGLALQKNTENERD